MACGPIWRLWARRSGAAIRSGPWWAARMFWISFREDRLGEARYVWFASSVGGNPVSATAALATLGELRRPGTYDRLFALGAALRAGLRAALAEIGVVAQVQGDGPLTAVAFTDRDVVDYRRAFGADKKRARAFLLGLFDQALPLPRPPRRRPHPVLRSGAGHPEGGSLDSARGGGQPRSAPAVRPRTRCLGVRFPGGSAKTFPPKPMR